MLFVRDLFIKYFGKVGLVWKRVLLGWLAGLKTSFIDAGPLLLKFKGYQADAMIEVVSYGKPVNFLKFG